MNGARMSCAIVLVALVSISASAQTSGPSAPPPPAPAVAPAMPLNGPSTVTGSPSTVTPLTPNSRPDLFQSGPTTYAPRFDRVTPTRGVRGGYGGGVVLPYGPLPPGFGPGDVAAAGYLQVDAQPSNAQVYVDGLLVGRVDDLRRMGQGRALEPGPHHVDVRADGYFPVSADVRVDPRETTVYRAELKSIAAETAPARAAAPPAVPKTFYVVAGCYAGTTRPRPEQLPPGCDARKLREVPPVVSRIDR